MIDRDLRAVPVRLALANLASLAVARTSGVGLSDADPDWATVSGSRRIVGITSIATAGGRYDMDLRIVAGWPPDPLRTVADELRERILSAARRAGLEDRVGEVNVHIVAVDGPDENGNGNGSGGGGGS